MIRINRALISVSNKDGLIGFVKGLNEFGVEIISTGGTAKLIKESGLPVKQVSNYTGFPEMLDGRVKTLNPKIHGGLLAIRNNPEHMAQLKEQGIGLIDMVVVNLYPFKEITSKPGVEEDEAIENIDIGGPSMLRSAAKNHGGVCVVCNPDRYAEVLSEMKKNGGCVSEETAKGLALEVFELTSRYDGEIAAYFSKRWKKAGVSYGSLHFPATLNITLEKIEDLRYGENPHQKAAFYRDPAAVPPSLALSKKLHGKELSFNNILDLDAALRIVMEFDEPACCVIKHNNPCGVASAKDLTQAFRDAYRCDPLSAFGGIVGLNKNVDAKTAKAISGSGFIECIIAPAYDKGALEILTAKKNVRILECGPLKEAVAASEGCGAERSLPEGEWDIKKVRGGFVAQDTDKGVISEVKVVTKKRPSKSQIDSLIFGMKIAKHVKSNAIVLTKGTRTVGIGAGQMSRVDSVYIALKKSGKDAKGSCLASDAFFPKEDAVAISIKSGIKAIAQPGGSIMDEAVIKLCDKKSTPMIFTGMRHFRH